MKRETFAGVARGRELDVGAKSGRVRSGCGGQVQHSVDGGGRAGGGFEGLAGSVDPAQALHDLAQQRFQRRELVAVNAEREREKGRAVRGEEPDLPDFAIGFVLKVTDGDNFFVGGPQPLRQFNGGGRKAVGFLGGHPVRSVPS